MKEKTGQNNPKQSNYNIKLTAVHLQYRGHDYWRGILEQLERSHSGRVRHLGKVVYPQGYRGFESLSLRQVIIKFMIQHTGLISFLILVCGLLFTVIRWKGGLHMTFSQHVARSRWSIVYYSALFAVSLPVMYLFFAGWFVPTFHLTDWFLIFVAISITTQFLCTLFPETGGWKTTVHRILTGISGVALLPLVSMMIGSPFISLSERVLAVVCAVVMGILLVIALRNQKGYRYALLLQVGYYAAFFLTVLYATYF